jgi:hypothetical protein
MGRFETYSSVLAIGNILAVLFISYTWNQILYHIASAQF